MAQPNPYNRAFNFSNFQAEKPATPLPGGSLDEELSRIKVVLDQVRTSIAFIQRDDYALANRSVGFDQLKTEINIGINPPSQWTTTTNYVVRDTVFENSNFYICEISHTSGVFPQDLADGKWSLIASFEAATSASSTSFDDSATGLGATTVQGALVALDGGVDAMADALSKLEAGSVAFTATGLAHTDGVNVQDALSDHDSAITIAAPPGCVLDYAGATAPMGWLMCGGQAVSRTTYAALFGVIGTVYGSGDGSTTFNVPDLRGRVTAGKDNMGGTVAGRLTGSHSGFDEALTLGGTGGSESHTLTQSELPVVTPTFTGSPLPAHGHPSRWGVNQGDSHDTTGGIGMVAAGQTDEAAHTGGLGSSPGQQIGGASAGTPTGTISSFGSGNEHANVQPTLILNKIIKT